MIELEYDGNKDSFVGKCRCGEIIEVENLIGLMQYLPDGIYECDACGHQDKIRESDDSFEERKAARIRELKKMRREAIEDGDREFPNLTPSEQDAEDSTDRELAELEGDEEE